MRLLQFLMLTLILADALACKSRTPQSNAPTTTTPLAGATAMNPAAVSPTPATVAGAQPGVNCGSCWAHVYDDKNYKETDDHLILCGPGKWSNMRGLPGTIKPEWADEIESIKVGPAATVQVWTGENQTGTTHTFNPGQEIPNIKIPTPLMSNSISSIEIKCR